MGLEETGEIRASFSHVKPERSTENSGTERATPQRGHPPCLPATDVGLQFQMHLVSLAGVLLSAAPWFRMIGMQGLTLNNQKEAQVLPAGTLKQIWVLSTATQSALIFKGPYY